MSDAKRRPARRSGSVWHFELRERLRTSLWFVPTLLVLSAALLGIALLVLDHQLQGRVPEALAFRGGSSGARQVVSTIAGSIVSFIAVVFSITILVLQIASSQFSPRVLRNFMRDRRSQVPLGFFLGTLVYALVVLWGIRSEGEGSDDAFVPTLAITGAYAMLLTSLGIFVFYINHVAHSIRVSSLVEQIGDEAREAIDRRYPDPFTARSDEMAAAARAWRDAHTGSPIASAGFGVVLAVQEEALVDAAQRAGGCVQVIPWSGRFLASGSPIAAWHGPEDALRDLDVARFVSLGKERTLEQDVAFGVRQLVDIAERALSPGVNDPTTAVAALDQLHELLRRLGGRAFPEELRHDSNGVLRLVLHERTWEDFVDLALAEIVHYGGDSPQIRSRIQWLIDDLLAAVPESRRAVLTSWRGRLPEGEPLFDAS